MGVQGDKIRTASQLQSSIRRIAYQIYENNLDEKELILVGVAQRGSDLALSFGKALEGFSTLKIEYATLSINKDLVIPTSIFQYSFDTEWLKPGVLMPSHLLL